MVDVVLNSMGNADVNFGRNSPFNDSAHYHDWCDISEYDFANHVQSNI